MLQLPISDCVSLIVVTITMYAFINIFHTEHFSAVKFVTGYKKIWALLWYENLQSLKKVEKNCTVLFK